MRTRTGQHYVPRMKGIAGHHAEFPHPLRAIGLNLELQARSIRRSRRRHERKGPENG